MVERAARFVVAVGVAGAVLLGAVGVGAAPTTDQVGAQGDVAAACAVFEELDAIDDLEDPTVDNAQQVAARLGAVVAEFEELAAVAPPEIADDAATAAARLAELQAIVQAIADAQTSPTPEQQAELDRITTELEPAIGAVAQWAEANCGQDATAEPATPTVDSPVFTG